MPVCLIEVKRVGNELTGGRCRIPAALRWSSQAGLRAGKSWRAAFPGKSQWLRGAPALAYRCGGSSGFVRGRTAFPFHRGGKPPTAP